MRGSMRTKHPVVRLILKGSKKTGEVVPISTRPISFNEKESARVRWRVSTSILYATLVIPARTCLVVCFMMYEAAMDDGVSSIQHIIASRRVPACGRLFFRTIISPRLTSISSFSVRTTDWGENASARSPS